MSIGITARGIFAKGKNLAADPLTGEITAHVAALRRYALVLVGDPHEADDLVQEAITRVLSHMRGLAAGA